MSVVQAQKNIETDNPKLAKGTILCKVLVSHIKAEFLDLYNLEDGARYSRVQKALMEHVRRVDSIGLSLIELDEAYDLYLEGYVVPSEGMKDPRPRADLLPYLTPKQKEAQAYLNGENRINGMRRNRLPQFVEDRAKREAAERTAANRKAVKAKALKGE